MKRLMEAELDFVIQKDNQIIGIEVKTEDI